ncbi:hypothetical protein PQ455_09325 [Sphingomonas naphthae]|uniref:Glycine zipper 2TM domain-containing protein n=1 Tax=Sphingomonas naphthae TaxID=1813468 RepID=A0ABY7TFE4_9SPHN|nr:glycine zipper domain-containing protein [Sphingomonas naphthae]WCT71855.1 hypothetical protein PQ455_09325 [Sphingomonas naphthae]
MQNGIARPLLVVALATSVVMVGGCSRGSTRGGLIGGAGGAVIGSATGLGTTEGAVIGGTAGAIIGDNDGKKKRRHRRD